MTILASTSSSFGNGSVLLWMLEFFLLMIWFWLLIVIFSDMFRDHSLSGGMKVLWSIFIIVIPFIGILCYLLIRGHSMAERSANQQQAMRQQMDAQIRQAVGTSGSAADQIAQAKGLLEAGTINQAEFDQLKAKALAS